MAAPTAAATNTTIPGIAWAIPDVPPTLPLLVLPCSKSIPECPFEVASTDGSTAAVFAVFVNAVVGNVTVWPVSDSDSALSLRKTSATEGAGTLIWHVLAFWSHWTVCMSRLP
jgi:hypothetical protein